MIRMNRIPLFAMTVRFTLTVEEEYPMVARVNSKVSLARIILMPTVVYAAIVLEELLLVLTGKLMAMVRVLASWVE